MNETEYRAHPAMNISRLKLIDQSPLHFRLGNPPATEAMQLGTKIHMALLEPEKFKRLYVCEPEKIVAAKRVEIKGKKVAVKDETELQMVNKRFKDHRDILEAWKGEQASDAVILTQNEMTILLGIINSLKHELSSPAKRDTLSLGEIMAMEHRELPVFNDDIFGRPAKGLLDLAGTSRFGKTIVDVKKVGKKGDASPNKFASIVGNMDYDAAAYWYKEVYGADKFYWLVVEENPIHPDHNIHATAIYDAEAYMELGKNKVNKWLDKLAECEKSEDWHCYTQGAQILQPTQWQVSKYSEDTVFNHE